MNFDESFLRLLASEGGYSNHASDPGGATNHGVTQAVARANGYSGDMRDFTLAQAKAIYRRQYWDAARRVPILASVDGLGLRQCEVAHIAGIAVGPCHGLSDAMVCR